MNIYEVDYHNIHMLLNINYLAYLVAKIEYAKNNMYVQKQYAKLLLSLFTSPDFHGWIILKNNLLCGYVLGCWSPIRENSGSYILNYEKPKRIFVTMYYNLFNSQQLSGLIQDKINYYLTYFSC